MHYKSAILLFFACLCVNGTSQAELVTGICECKPKLEKDKKLVELAVNVLKKFDVLFILPGLDKEWCAEHWFSECELLCSTSENILREATSSKETAFLLKNMKLRKPLEPYSDCISGELDEKDGFKKVDRLDFPVLPDVGGEELPKDLPFRRFEFPDKKLEPEDLLTLLDDSDSPPFSLPPTPDWELINNWIRPAGILAAISHLTKRFFGKKTGTVGLSSFIAFLLPSPPDPEEITSVRVWHEPLSMDEFNFGDQTEKLWEEYASTYKKDRDLFNFSSLGLDPRTALYKAETRKLETMRQNNIHSMLEDYYRGAQEILHLLQLEKEIPPTIIGRVAAHADAFGQWQKCDGKSSCFNGDSYIWVTNCLFGGEFDRTGKTERNWCANPPKGMQTIKFNAYHVIREVLNRNRQISLPLLPRDPNPHAIL